MTRDPSRTQVGSATLRVMDHDEGVDDPLSTLLARVASGDEAARVAAARFGPDAVALDPDDLVLWLGDVVDAGCDAAAAAVVRIEGATTVVRAAAAEDVLVDRLGREVAALASARGCTTIEADPEGPGVPGPTAVIARAGLVGDGSSRWTIDE